MIAQMKANALRISAFICLAVFVSACAETQFLVHTAKRVTQQQKQSEPSEYSPEISAMVGKGIYKIGNPYQIYNIWYYPEVDYDYDETGIASWYGKKFHGRKTANGEIYNMNDLTAAHKTLPIPSWVEVTNLDNGRKLKLRLNDRGPYAKSRIIDISRRGAQLLGFQNQGTAKIRVRILANESRNLAAAMRGEATIGEYGSPITVDSLPKASVNTVSLEPPPGADVATPPPDPEPKVETASLEPVPQPQSTNQLMQNDGIIENVPVTDVSIFIQAGAFTDYSNAVRAQAILSQMSTTSITQIEINQREYFRVRVGPYDSVDMADAVLDQAVALGYPDSRIIVD
jgi:rare lipoprotein A